jgi:nitrile hydratase
VVLEEMGTHVGDDVQIRIYDSSADTRYMVIPIRPPGTEGLSEQELADLVTRDSLIGVGDALAPFRK